MYCARKTLCKSTWETAEKNDYREKRFRVKKNRDTVRKCLIERRESTKMIKAVKSLYKQGCNMSPLFFILLLDEKIWAVLGQWDVS